MFILSELEITALLQPAHAMELFQELAAATELVFLRMEVQIIVLHLELLEYAMTIQAVVLQILVHQNITVRTLMTL